jgi:hypothetical protein
VVLFAPGGLAGCLHRLRLRLPRMEARDA